MRRRALLALAAAVPAWGAPQGDDLLPRFSTAPPAPGAPPGWRHETLPKVERANAYEIVSEGDGARVLRITSSASASSLAAAPARHTATQPMLRWRWRVSRALSGSDLRTKAGDDYAARLYVLFDLPLDRLPLGDRLRLQAARALSGRDIPAAALCYVWGTAQPVGTSAPNPYTDRVRMVVAESGDAHAMQWRTVERDLRADWQAAFTGEMPPLLGIAVGADTDNTGEAVQAWFGDVVLAGRA
jgi:hypothetical protein